jgi:hypothetical protein
MSMHMSSEAVKDSARIGAESRLEGGVNRRNLKIINLSTHYKSGLALELKSSLKEREKTNQRQMKRVTR